jgi:hypothetical protein
MVVRFAFDAGAEGSLHSHPHVQATYVASGRFRFTVSGEVVRGRALRQLRHPWRTPSTAAPASPPGELIDSFSPRRDDFL